MRAPLPCAATPVRLEGFAEAIVEGFTAVFDEVRPRAQWHKLKRFEINYILYMYLFVLYYILIYVY